MCGLFLALLAPGCGSFGLNQAPAPDSGDTAATGVLIQGISPGYGPLTGDTQVTITGWGFGQSPIVTWGSTLADVVAASDTLLLVSSPASVTPGAVDITVSSELGSDTLVGAFVYTNDGGDRGDTGGAGGDTGGYTDDSTSSGGDTGSAPVEGTAALAQINYQYTLCPECFLPPLETEAASAQVAFFDPITVDFLDHLPALGTCAPGVSAPDRGLAYRDAGALATLSSGSRLITLYPSSGGGGAVYEASTGAVTMSASDIAHSAAYDLSVAGGADVSAAEIEGAVYTAQFYEDISPDTSGSFSYSLSPSQPTTWSWSPTGGAGGHMLVLYDFYNASGTYTGGVACHGEDSGSLTAPASAVTGATGSYVTITLARLETGSTPLPEGQGDLFYMSVASVMGTGRVR